MHTLAEADAKNAISVLQSDIRKVHEYAEKVEAMIQRKCSGSEDTIRLRKNREEREAIWSLKSGSSEQGRLRLLQRLNAEMMNVEKTVFESICEPGELEVSSSMSRLPIWIKLLDRHMWTYNPDSVSAPKIVGKPNIDYGQMFAPVQNLL